MTNVFLVLMSEVMLYKNCILKHNHVALYIRKTFTTLKYTILHFNQF